MQMTHPLSAQDRATVDRIVHDTLASSGTPGAIAGLWLGERGEYVATYGVGDRETGTEPRIEDHFRIASITKTFVGTVLLQLVDEGAVALDTPLSDFDFDFPKSASATLADLLGMTAGIFDYTRDKDFDARYDADPLMRFTPDDALAIARRYEPLFAPGTSISYCDTNTVLAGKIGERVSGRSIEQLVTERIIEPYRLSNTSFPNDPDIPEPVLRGYSKLMVDAPLRDVTRSDPNVAWAAGAMISTLSDLRTWAKLLADGALLSAKTQAARLQVQALHPGQPVQYGLGIANLAGFLGHNGSIAGYNSMMLRDPSIDATIVIAANLSWPGEGAADTIAMQVLQAFYPERFTAPPASRT